MGHENTRRKSRERLLLLFIEVYETAAIITLMLKCRPRMHMWARLSSPFPVTMTSSIKIKICRSTPSLFKSSCCDNNLSIRGWFHELKKKRGSHFGWAASMASRVGEQAADPTKQTIRSNTLNIWYTKWAMLVDLPQRRAPTAASTKGTRSLIRSGSHSVSTIAFIT